VLPAGVRGFLDGRYFSDQLSFKSDSGSGRQEVTFQTFSRLPRIVGLSFLLILEKKVLQSLLHQILYEELVQKMR